MSNNNSNTRLDQNITVKTFIGWIIPLATIGIGAFITLQVYVARLGERVSTNKDETKEINAKLDHITDILVQIQLDLKDKQDRKP